MIDSEVVGLQLLYAQALLFDDVLEPCNRFIFDVQILFDLIGHINTVLVKVHRFSPVWWSWPPSCQYVAQSGNAHNAIFTVVIKGADYTGNLLPHNLPHALLGKSGMLFSLLPI